MDFTEYWSLRGGSSDILAAFQPISQKARVAVLDRWLLSRKMSYFVIGVSGVTCGGKTTMSKLLQRSFPWSKVIHQDKYFYPEDYEGHVRFADMDNHINFEVNYFPLNCSLF